MHKETTDSVVPEDGRGETKWFARSALDSWAPRERLAVNLLRVEFAPGVSRRRQGTVVASGRSGRKVLQPQRLQPLLPLDQAPICAPAACLRQDSPTQMLPRLPPPALVGFALPQAPPFLCFCGLPSAHFDHKRSGTTPLTHAGVYRREAGGFFLLP